MIQATSRSTTKRLLAAGAAALGLLAAGSAMADSVYWSVGVSAPLDGGRVRTHVGNVPPAAPVVVAPAPVVYAPPPPVYGYPAAYPTAYYGAPRVVYAPPPVVYGRGFGWRHDHGWHGHRGWRGEAYRDGYREGRRDDRRDGWRDGRRDGHRH